MGIYTYWIKRIVIWFLAFSLSWVIIDRFLPVPFTYLMLLRAVEEDSAPIRKDWVAGEDISMNLKRAVIASEDQSFVEHYGFDGQAIWKAFKRNLKSKKLRGGSTISQQTAKNVFLWPGRSYIRKLLEAYYTMLVELFWSKERIMTVYLNVIEMGDGIYGAEAAAQHYFKKSAAELTKSEAALIAAVLPNPRKWSPAKPNAYILKRQRSILNRMNKLPTPSF